MSKTLPDWIRLGEESRVPIWYQRAPSRLPEPDPLPAASMRMLCAVQMETVPSSGLVPIIASKSLSSSASMPPVVP